MNKEPTGVDAARADRTGAPVVAAAGDWPRPVGRPASAHWWSVQPPPPGDRISARRAYAEVLVVFAAFFAANVLIGGEALAGHYLPPFGSWAFFMPQAVGALAKCVLAVLVVALLSARRGISPRSLGYGWARKGDGSPGAAQSLRIAAWAIAAVLVGGWVTIHLAHGHHMLAPLAPDYSYLVYSMTASLNAGIVEETVALAFVVTTLRQARRPLPEIFVVAVVLRCSFHDYYGWGVLGIAVWASIFVWLYLRSGSILPMIVVHVVWDVGQFLGLWWPAVRIVWSYLLASVLIVAVVSWLVSVARRGRRIPVAPGADAMTLAPPG